MRRVVRSPGLAIALACLGVAPMALAQNVSAPAMLQWFEGSYRTQERRAADFFAAGYGGIWMPPPGRADSGNGSVGYDVYDRFDLGKPGNPTLYGTETGIKTTIKTLQRAGGSVYIDYVVNHSGFTDAGTSGFTTAGDYPGFVLNWPGTSDGDYHSVYANDPNEPYDIQYRLAGLVDLDHRTNIQVIRHPVPGYANNIPAGTTPLFGRLADVPDENNRKFYPDRNLTPIMVYDPKTGEGNIAIYPFNNANPMAGDPVAENAMGYLMRHAQWLVQVVGVDGFRIDAARHVQPFALEYFDRAVYRSDQRTYLDGSRRNVFTFQEAYTGDRGYLQTFVRKDINPAQIGVVGGNRDVLDFPLFFSMRDNLTGNGLTNNWNNIKNASQDVQDDGLANNGSQAVAFAVSHDDGGAYLSNVAHAYMLMRPGNAIVYYNAKEFGDGRDFPKDGRGDALGGLYGNAITTLVNLRNTHGRGNYIDRTPGGDTKEMLIYERQKSALVVLSNRVDGGFDSRTIQTSFEPGQWLIELTGNASNATIDPFNDFPELIQVNSDRTVNLRVPRNRAPGSNGAEHKSGYLIYGLSGPQGNLSISGVASTLGPETPTAATNGTARLSAIDVITGNTIQVNLATNAVNLLGFARDQDADGDNAMLKLDDGAELNGNGQVDYRTPNTVVYGFEEFTTTKSPGYFNANGNGQYAQTINTANLSEGYHFLEARAFRHRADGGQAIYTSFRRTLYVDRLKPISAVDSFDPIVSGVNENRRVTVRSTDLTGDNVHVFLDLPAGLTESQVLALVGGPSQSNQLDRDLWTKDFTSLTHGNHVLTVVTYEITGNVAVQRFPGRFVSTIFGAGLGDTNFNGTYAPDDITSFGTVLNSNNAQFNPAADLNGDGLVDDTDLFALSSRLGAVNADGPTYRAYNILLLNNAAATTRTVAIPLNNSAGLDLTKTTAGTVYLSGPQAHGTGASMNLNAGTVHFNSDAGSAASRTLALTVNGGAVAQFEFPQHLASLTVNDGGRVNVSPGGVGLVVTSTLGIGASGKLDLTDNHLIVQAAPGQEDTVRDQVQIFIRTARAGNWSGPGLTSTDAASNPLRTLGIILNDLGGNVPRYATFRGQAVNADATLVSYTWAGDLNLDGLIDIDDYFAIDVGYARGLSGYWNGDVNYSGTITADDYFLMDAAYLGGGGSISAFAPIPPEPAAVPEPAALALLMGAGLLARRRARA